VRRRSCGRNREVDEFEIIREYFDRPSIDASVITGVGDDGAVTRLAPDRDLLNVIDTLVAGVHFPISLDAADVGYRAVAVNVSDIAAMGGKPTWMTLALTLTESSSDWLNAFASGLYAAADEYGVTLTGGDTTRGDQLVITIQMNGEIETGQALLRSGARPGDSIYVTGTPGDAAAGLSILQKTGERNSDADYLVSRFARPAARPEIGQAVVTIAHAAIDLSDGLYADIEKLLSASTVSGSIELDDLPLSAQLTRSMSHDAALQFALGGGDDYELCFTSNVGVGEIQAIAAGFDVAVTRVGQVDEGTGLILTSAGRNFDYQSVGYRHFR